MANFKLVACEAEPMATFERALFTDEAIQNPHETKPVSAFADYVLLKPTKPIEKKVEKKPRSDIGKAHKKPKEGEAGEGTG